MTTERERATEWLDRMEGQLAALDTAHAKQAAIPWMTLRLEQAEEIISALLRSPVGEPHITEAWLRERFPWISGRMFVSSGDALHGLYREVADALCSADLPVGEPVAWRPEVRAFATLMEERLRENDAEKGTRGWKKAPCEKLLAGASGECRELGVAVRKLGPDEIAHEAADVANFAMMVADVCGALPAPPAAPEAQEPDEDAEIARGVQRMLDEEHWDASVGQIHRELAGEVPPPDIMMTDAQARERIESVLDESRRKVRPYAEGRGAIHGAPGNWIAPYHQCCGHSLDWHENGHAIEATCPATGEYHAFVLMLGVLPEAQEHGHEGNPHPVLHERDERGNWICCCGDHLEAKEPERLVQAPCYECGGTGVGGYVTREMATDACDLSLVDEPVPCGHCDGNGWTMEPTVSAAGEEKNDA